jgi:hypothetical protein
MAEYIDREALLKEMLGLHTIPVYIGHVTDEDIMFETMVDVVKEQPAADVVPVVRCKDCKYCRKTKGNERYTYFEGVLLCESFEMSDDVCAVNPEDFCSYGERRCSDG